MISQNLVLMFNKIHFNINYFLIISFFLLASCELFEKNNNGEIGICVFYELTLIGNTPIHDYDCWDDTPENTCSSNWYSNQTCEEFCAEKLTEEYTLCEIY